MYHSDAGVVLLASAGRTLARMRQILGEDSLHTLGLTTYLAAILMGLGQHERARQLGEDTLTRLRRVLGEEHPDTLRAAHNLHDALANLDIHVPGRRPGE
jgi:Tetratricopeptide repeat